MSGPYQWEKIERKDVIDEIHRRRIRDALARQISDVDIAEVWKDMKRKRAANPKPKIETVWGPPEASQRRKEVRERMLKELRGLDVERTDLDEMVALSAFGRSMKVEYERLVIPIPEWLEDRLQTLDRETRLRRTDALEKKKKELLARKETLKTAEQKRQDVDAELAKVEAALGGTSA